MPENSIDLKGYRLVLASKSPRRQELLKGLDLDFEIRTLDVDESFSPDLKAAEVPEYLAAKKADAFFSSLGEHEILITSDTVVCLGDEIFNKPSSHDDALEMIMSLSGKEHEVITAVCICSLEKRVVFHDKTKVLFTELDRSEVEHYVNRYEPFDKAGAYGIQEWIGYVAIERIEGSFYNVMGLPTHRLYRELKYFHEN